MTGTDGHVHPQPVSGQAVATGVASVVGLDEVTWVPVPGATITVPGAGTYDLWADAHGGIVASTPPVDEVVFARLFNVTAGTAIAETETEVTRAVYPETSSTSWGVGSGGTAAIRWAVTVTGPTTFRLEASHDVGGNSGGAGPGGDVSGVGSDGGRGLTRIGYVKIN